jgi:transcriptional regulator with XRE-family HTH domain
MKNTKCHICNSDLKITDIKGTIFPWKDFNFVELLTSFNSLSCQQCGETIISATDTELLDEALENSIRIQTATFLQQIKQTSKLSQKELAKKMGITEVYFSEIISRKKTVSYQIFNYFKLLAKSPNNLNDLNYFERNNSKYNLQAAKIKFNYLELGKIEQLAKDQHFRGIMEIERG